MQQNTSDVICESYIDMYEAMSEENKSRYITYIVQKILRSFINQDLKYDNAANDVVLCAPTNNITNQKKYIVKKFQKDINIVFAINNLDLFLKVKDCLAKYGFRAFLNQENNILFLSIAR